MLKIPFFTDLNGNAEVSISVKLEDIRVNIARYIVSAKERTTFLLPVSFLRANAILGVSVENIPGKLDSDLGCDQLFPLEENGIENREMRDEADSLLRPFNNALQDTEIYGGGWYFQSDVTQNVMLGVVVTVFENTTYTVISNVLNFKDGIKSFCLQQCIIHCYR